jgi:hypothetical protein
LPVGNDDKLTSYSYHNLQQKRAKIKRAGHCFGSGSALYRILDPDKEEGKPAMPAARKMSERHRRHYKFKNLRVINLKIKIIIQAPKSV